MSNSKRASEEAIEALHAALAETLCVGLKEIKKALSDPEVGEVKGAAALLNVARQFVKDNGIEALGTPQSPLGNLVNELPFDSEGTHREESSRSPSFKQH